MMIKKSCANCGSIFETTTSNTKKKYCSDACKSQNWKRRNGKVTKVVLVDEQPKEIVKKVEKPTLNQETKDSFFSLGANLPKRVPNPEYEKVVAQITTVQSKIKTYTQQKNKLVSKIEALMNRNQPLMGALIGASGGALTSFLSKDNKFVYGLLGGLIGGVAGFFIGQHSQNANEQKVFLEIENLNNEIAKLDAQIQAEQNNLSHWVQKKESTPKRISETFIQNYTEDAVILESSKKDIFGFGDLLTPLPNTKTNQENKVVPKGSKIMNLESFKNIQFKTLDFSIHSEYYSLFGSPAENFKLMIYGKSGHGKSTFSIEFAEFLALNFGRVLYNSSEEGLSKSLQKKVQDIQTDLFDLAFCKSAKELIHELSQPYLKTPRFLVIDSINHMKITPQELQDIINLDKNRSVIWLMQTTKTGVFRGDNEFAHESDIILKFENYTPIVDKTRFK
jgi:hypothetical protein